MVYVPTSTVELTTQEDVDTVLSFIEKIDEDEDVDEIFTNVQVSDSLG